MKNNKRHSCTLRSLTWGDRTLVLSWRNSEHVRKYMYTDHPISMGEHEAWLQATLRDDSVDVQLFLYAGQPMGLVTASRIDRRNGACYWAFYLGEEAAPNGTGARMEYLALERYFEIQGMRKIMCEVFAFNSSVIRMHEKFGFVREAYFSKHVLKEGKYEDVVGLALFSDKWREVKDRMHEILFDRNET